MLYSMLLPLARVYASSCVLDESKSNQSQANGHACESTGMFALAVHVNISKWFCFSLASFIYFGRSYSWSCHIYICNTNHTYINCLGPFRTHTHTAHTQWNGSLEMYTIHLCSTSKQIHMLCIRAKETIIHGNQQSSNVACIFVVGFFFGWNDQIFEP